MSSQIEMFQVLFENFMLQKHDFKFQVFFGVPLQAHGIDFT
jgi:hypothetical protein